jgi:hypothetical protein
VLIQYDVTDSPQKPGEQPTVISLGGSNPSAFDTIISEFVLSAGTLQAEHIN